MLGGVVVWCGLIDEWCENILTGTSALSGRLPDGKMIKS
jgi:hypothetical protein